MITNQELAYKFTDPIRAFSKLSKFEQRKVLESGKKRQSVNYDSLASLAKQLQDEVNYVRVGI